MDFLITLWVWFLIPLLTVLVTIPISLLSTLFSPLDPQRKWAHRVGVFWGKAIIGANLRWKLQINGRQHIKSGQSYVVISNHASMTDIMILYNLGMQFKWLAKSSLFKIPFLGWNMSLMQYIPLERGRHGSIRKSYHKAKEWLKQGMSVLIFPEGTRSRDGSLSEFRNGAFKMAIELQKPILPIVLFGTEKTIPKGQWLVGPRIKMSLSVLPPVETKDYDPNDFEKLKNTVHDLMRKEIERKRLSLNA